MGGPPMSLHVELLLRIAVATALGAVIGLERQIHRRPAGLRTHMLVALASATFMVVSTHFVYFQHYHKDDLVTVDPSRIAASVVAGTGFLAGGAILRTGLSVQGLTTGAGLWLVSSIGLAAGGGHVSGEPGRDRDRSRRPERRAALRGQGRRGVRRRVAVTTVGGADALPGLVAAIRAAGCAVSDSEYESVREEGRLTVAFDVDAPLHVPLETLLRAAESQPGVVRVRIAPPG